MDLGKILTDQGIDIKGVHALRHRPSPPKFNQVLPWLAAERPELFNAYQQSQGPQVEKAISKAKYVVSCIAHGSGKALFIGLYEVKGWQEITKKGYWDIPENVELASLGNPGFEPEEERKKLLWFDLAHTDILSKWKGKLVVGWPPPAIKWHRPLTTAHMPILAIHEDSALVKALPAWDEIDLGWAGLHVIPSNLRTALAQWRGTTSSTIPATGWGTSARRMAREICSGDGRTMVHPGTVAISCFSNASMRILDSRFCSASVRTWKLTR